MAKSRSGEVGLPPSGYDYALYRPTGTVDYARQVPEGSLQMVTVTGGTDIVQAVGGDWIVRDGDGAGGVSVWSDDRFRREFVLIEDAAEAQRLHTACLQGERSWRTALLEAMAQ